MSRRAPARAPVALLAVALACVAAPAHAKVTLQAVGTVAAGWTDNVLDAPTQPVAPQSPPVSDFFFQLQPGAALTSAAPRVIQRLGYTFSADLFVTHSEGNSYSNTLDWSGFFATSKSSELLLVLVSQQGRLNTFNLNLPASAGVATVVTSTSTSTNFFSQLFTEGFGWDVDSHWRATQTTALQIFIPIDRGQLADSYNLVEELAADRRFRVDSLGALLRCDFVDYEPIRDPVTDVASLRLQQVITSLVGRWRRDWSPSWSSEAALGVVEASQVAGPDPKPAPTWGPSALAALRWVRQLSTAELRYAHDILPNPLASATFIYDAVSLRGSVALPERSHLFLGATVEYQHAQQTAVAAAGTSADVLLADASIDYRPRPEIGVFARYTLFDQFGAPPSPSGPATFPSLRRNTVLVGLSIVYPALAAARVPNRAGSRVDRSDQPSFPELHSQPRP